MSASETSFPLSVLVVDDDADMRLYLRSCLRSVGPAGRRPDVMEATDGRDALRLVRDLLPDLIISDLVMPEMDGLDLYRALNADSTLAAIPILFISGEIRPPFNMDAFLAKPFNATQLRAAVQRLLRGPSSQTDFRPSNA